MTDAHPEQTPDQRALVDLITRATQAGGSSTEELSDILYKELRRLARAYMHRERREHTLQPTALANEAYLRLIGGADLNWQGRAHFLAIAARTMRIILVDHARKRGAQKRGGDRERVPLQEAIDALGTPDLDVLDVEEALTELRELDARKVEVVEMRFFGGMTAKDIATVLGISPATVQDDWYAARAWLRARLGD